MEEKTKYESLFPRYHDGDGFVQGKEAVELLSKSGLDRLLLKKVKQIKSEKKKKKKKKQR
jgi:hypothetical protein